MQDSFEIPCGVIFVFKYQEVDLDDDYLKIESNYDTYKRKKQQKEKKKTGRYIFIDSLYHNYEKLYLELQLEEKGEYHILCFSQFENFDLKYSLIISSYSNLPLELYYLNRKDYSENWLLYLLKQLAIENKCYAYFDFCEPESYYINYLNHKSNNTGFGILYYENNSQETDLKVKIALNDNSSFKVLNCHKDKELSKKGVMSAYVFTVEKRSHKFLLIQFCQPMQLVNVQAKHDLCFDFSSQRIVRSFLKRKTTKREVLVDGLTLNQIKYDRGFVFYLKNTSKSIYSFWLSIEKNQKSNSSVLKNMKNYEELDEKREYNIIKDKEDDEIEELDERVIKENERNSNKNGKHVLLLNKQKELNPQDQFFFHLKTISGNISSNDYLEYDHKCVKIK